MLIRLKKLFLIILFSSIATSLPAQKTEITFWFSAGFTAKEFIEERVAEYNAVQSLVKIKAIFQGLYQDMEVKMLAAAATRQLPDIAQEKFEYMYLYINENLIEPIDTSINEYDKNDILPVMWDVVSRNGHIYGVPFCVNTSIFFYNTDILKEAGLDPEKLPATWEEIIEVGKKVTFDRDGDGKIDRYAMVMWQNGLNSIAPILWSNGGSLFSEDGKRVVLTSEAMIKTITMLRDLVYKDKIMPSTWTDTEGIQAFLTGKLAMGPFISGGLVYLEENLPWTLKTAPMPSINGRRYSALTGSALINFSTNKKKRKAANDFIFWLVNEENTIKIFKEVGYLPVRKSALNSLEIKSFINENPNFKAPIDALNYSRALPNHREYFKINQMFMDMLERIVREGSDPISELENTERLINKMLE